MTEVKIEYPKFYSAGTRCLKRESDVKAIEVKIPAGTDSLPCVHERVTYPSKERLDEEVASMKAVEKDMFESYLAAYFQAADKNRKKFNEHRQKHYDKTGVV